MISGEYPLANFPDAFKKACEEAERHLRDDPTLGYVMLSAECLVRKGTLSFEFTATDGEGHHVRTKDGFGPAVQELLRRRQWRQRHG